MPGGVADGPEERGAFTLALLENPEEVRGWVHQRILCDHAAKGHGVEPHHHGLEITTGSRRINEYPMLLDNVEMFGLKPEGLADCGRPGVDLVKNFG